MLLWRATKKKNVECCSKEQRIAFSESSFELALTLSLKWFCKIPFSNSTYFKLKVLIAECVPLKCYKEISVKCCSKKQRSPHSELTFKLVLTLSQQWFCKIPLNFFRFNLFRIESLNSLVCYFREPWKNKVCWMLHQGTVKSVFRVIFWIGFNIITLMILQNNIKISRLNLYRSKCFDS